MNKLSKRSKDTLKGVHPDLVKVIEAAITDCPVDFTVVQGVRTAEYQNSLYQQGRTKPGPKVTDKDGYKKKSNHQIKADGYGHAVDLYPYVNGAADVNDKQNLLPVIAAHVMATAKCMGVALEWGGNWKVLVDKPHFELS